MTTFVQVPFEAHLYATNCILNYGSATTVSIGPGQIRGAENNLDIKVESEITLDLSVNGVNGLDTGDLANTSIYYVYLIVDALNYKPIAGIASLVNATSISDIIFPQGYNYLVRVGAFATNSSAQILSFIQLGTGMDRWMLYTTPSTVLNAQGSATPDTYVNLDLSAVIPATSQLVKINWTMVPDTAGNGGYVRNTGNTPTISTYYGSVASQPNSGNDLIITNTSQSIDWKTTASADDLTLVVQGYYDTLFNIVS